MATHCRGQRLHRITTDNKQIHKTNKYTKYKQIHKNMQQLLWGRQNSVSTKCYLKCSRFSTTRKDHEICVETEGLPTHRKKPSENITENPIA